MSLLVNLKSRVSMMALKSMHNILSYMDLTTLEIIPGICISFQEENLASLDLTLPHSNRAVINCK